MIDRSEGVLNSMTDAAASLEDGSVRLARAAKKAEEAGDLGAEASVHLQQATQELDGASELWESASAHFSSAIQLAQEALYGEGDATLQDVLSELNAAGEDAEKAKDSLDKAVEHTDTAIEELEAIGEPVSEASRSSHPPRSICTRPCPRWRTPPLSWRISPRRSPRSPPSPSPPSAAG